MRKKDSKSGTPSLALQAAALQHHYAASLKSGHGVAKKLAPGIGLTVQPKERVAAAEPPSILLQKEISLSWECEGCGHFERTRSHCSVCGDKRVRVSGSGGSEPSTLSLAQRMGLVEKPKGPPSGVEWEVLETLACARIFHDSTPLTCPICRSSCGLRD